MAPSTEYREEWAACKISPYYFLCNYCQIEDATRREWVPFDLWEAQAQTIDAIRSNQLVVILKARQMGFTWLCLGYSLWQMIFWPAPTILLFSKRDDEAIEMLDYRLRGMYDKLPAWMRFVSPMKASKHGMRLVAGSRAIAFPTTAGRSYTATLAIVDEADYVPDLGRLLNAVKPTIDAGGKLILLSSVDKSQPESTFKRIYRAARQGENAYFPVFHGWNCRPERTKAWYEAERRNVLAQTGSLDDLHQEYPATEAEALAPRSLDKRIAPAWIQQCYKPMQALTELAENAPSIPSLEVFREPEPNRFYCIGADPAEGNPTSDDSALTVVDVQIREEVASLAGKYQPSVLASHADSIGRWYNEAFVMCERNNHGHAVILWLEANSTLLLLSGHDGRTGWLSSGKGKTLLYDSCADAFRNRETVLHSFAGFTQLSSIEGSTLRAPAGQHDDVADSFSLALAGVPIVLSAVEATEMPQTVIRP